MHSEAKETERLGFGAKKDLLQLEVVHILKSLELPKGFWQSLYLKGRCGGAGGRMPSAGYVISLVQSSLTGSRDDDSSRMVSQGLILSVLRFQQAWGYVCAYGHQSVPPLVGKGDSHLQNNSGNVHQILVSR